MADFLNPLIAAVAGLGGVFLGGWLGDRRERDKRRNDFITRQLSEFYGPLVSMRAEIRARADLRVKLERAIDRIHARDMSEAGQYSREASRQVSDENIAKLRTMMRDEGQIFRETSMPIYRQMLSTFRDKMWLAEPATRTYLPGFVEYIDVWERNLRDTVPLDVVGEIGHTEKNLHSFYQHLEETHDRLREVLAREQEPFDLLNRLRARLRRRDA
jgi:hypothetical protein